MSAMRVRFRVTLSSRLIVTIPLAGDGMACMMENERGTGGLTRFITWSFSEVQGSSFRYSVR